MEQFPSEINSNAEDEQHAVRCCDESGSTCISPTPCELAATYEEAKTICSNKGLSLCPINDNLTQICCGTGCDIDLITMWLRDIRETEGFSQQQFSSSSKVIGGGGDGEGSSYSSSSQSSSRISGGGGYGGGKYSSYQISQGTSQGSGFHSVTNGCVKQFPREITSQSAEEQHAVRCCDASGSTCMSPRPCELAATYEEAKAICLDQGLDLCPVNEKINEICCGTGCDIDLVTMWLRDGKENVKITRHQFSNVISSSSNSSFGSHSGSTGQIKFSTTSKEG